VTNFWIYPQISYERFTVSTQVSDDNFLLINHLTNSGDLITHEVKRVIYMYFPENLRCEQGPSEMKCHLTSS